MKVLDLQCGQLHVFEGWFGSEDDFQGQLQRGLVQCPVCANVAITKRLSAPRLNLGSARELADSATPAQDAQPSVPTTHRHALQTALMAVARHVVANSTDVGDNFAEEARKIHYGERAQRNIRGQTTPAEAQALTDEGIVVVPLLLPESLKGPLQ